MDGATSSSLFEVKLGREKLAASQRQKYLNSICQLQRFENASRARLARQSRREYF